MNFNVFILGLVAILSSVSIGLLILSSTYKLLKWYGNKRLDIGHNNLSYSIFIASILFAIGYLASGVIQPILSSFRVLSATTDNYGAFFGSFLGYGAIYIAIAYASGLAISLAGITIYSMLTPIDEFTELKNNNIGVAIIVSAIVITLILMSKDGVVMIIESIVPYPELPPR